MKILFYLIIIVLFNSTPILSKEYKIEVVKREIKGNLRINYLNLIDIDNSFTKKQSSYNHVIILKKK